MRTIILASGSPRRRELLKQIGLPFKVHVSNFEEDDSQTQEPHKRAQQLSLGKARVVATKYKNAVIIAADSFVAYKGKVLSKPGTKSIARKMLRELSGKSHPLITGFTIIDSKTGKTVSKSAETRVYMKKLSSKDIEDYIKTGEPLDKAGAYGIQGRGAILVRKIDGDYSNVVGLPLPLLAEELKKFKVNVLG